MRIELRKSYWLESARSLPHLAEGHPCREVHGHSFQLIFRLVGELKQGEHWLIDYNEIDQRTKALREALDHKNLNQVVNTPTTENLARFIFDSAKESLPHLVQVILCETRDTECRYPSLFD